ncbi:MAG: hypothetical protein ACJ749_11820 [Flavisolibacter sp.]
MNKTQDMKNRLKDALKSFLFQNDEAVVDPSKLQISEKAVGGKVEQINEDGSLSPVADGDYQDADGTPFSVKDGLITEWNGEKEAPKEEAPAEEMADEPAKEEAPASNEVADLKAMVDEQAKAIEELKGQVAELINAIEGNKAAEAEMAAQFNKQVSDLTETIKVILKTPAEFSKTNNSNVVKDAKEEKMNDYAKAWASIKNKN